MRSSGWTLIHYDWLSFKREFEHRDAPKGRLYEPTKEEGGHLQANERDLDQVLPHSFRRNQSCQYIIFDIYFD